MKFAVGYQLPAPDEEPFSEIVREWHDHVAEVYFAAPGAPSGRSPLPDDADSRRRFYDDLSALREMGVGLDLLLNANCYGGPAMSRSLEGDIADELARLCELAGGVEVVTTTSPAIAEMVRRAAPNVEIRASVNMRLGTIDAMEHLAALFDGYYVQRDFNRDLPHLRRLRTWADRAGKRLYMLANSGCLAFCAGQTFHDNLVAHEREVAVADNIDGFMPYTCWRLLADRANWPLILRGTWVRPEDLHHYEGLFETVKLATRMHDRPWVVLRAYAEGRWAGNLLDLLEPGYARALAPFVIDNTRFPPDWFERTISCGRRCESCDYCREVLDRVLVSLA